MQKERGLPFPIPNVCALSLGITNQKEQHNTSYIISENGVLQFQHSSESR